MVRPPRTPARFNRADQDPRDRAAEHDERLRELPHNHAVERAQAGDLRCEEGAARAEEGAYRSPPTFWAGTGTIPNQGSRVLFFSASTYLQK